MISNDVWKYCYWIKAISLSILQQELLKKGIHMTEAKQNPCEAMIGEIGYAEPHIWSVICKYDAAPWYNTEKGDALKYINNSIRKPAVVMSGYFFA